MQRAIKLVLCAVLPLSVTGLLPAKVPIRPWQSGQVTAAGLSGHGSSNGKGASGQDIWWNYCISAEELSYSVVSRESPQKTGMTLNSPVKFQENKNRISIQNPKGKPVEMRLLRKDKSRKCPPEE
jgi:hypothetical protein